MKWKNVFSRPVCLLFGFGLGLIASFVWFNIQLDQLDKAFFMFK